MDTGAVQHEKVHGEALAGALASLTILPAIAPFGMLYGALAINAGFEPWQAWLASATVYAGASQYLMLEMLDQSLSPLAILLAMLAINFRHVLYSAALGRHLVRFSRGQKALAFGLMVDPVFAAGEQRARRTGTLGPRWYFGYALAVYAVWMLSNVLGTMFGALIPDPASWGLDYVLPLYFLGLLTGFRASSGFVPVLGAAVLGSIGMHLTVGAPYHILGGSLAGLAVAVWRVPSPPSSSPPPGSGA